MKNNIFLLLFFCLFSNNLLLAETFRFESSDIEILENGNFILAKNGKAISIDNNFEIEAEIFEYSKKLDFLKALKNGEASIKSENLKIKFDKMIIDQKNLTINASGNVEIYQINEKLLINTESIIFDRKNRVLSSKTNSTLTDNEKNTFTMDSFEYEINNNILKLENANFTDYENNKFHTSIAFINTKTNKLFGKNINIDLNNKSFNTNNDPRLKGNSIIKDKEVTEITKGVFTTCKKRDDCPPWQLSAEKITHDKKKKMMNYKNALLKVYDVPVMYFPKFFHPDPTVKRKSGFLIPTFKNSNSNSYLNVPYFLAIAQNKDATFSPRFYTEDKFLIQTEYRQKNLQSSHTSDLSLFADNDTNTKNHFFYEFEKNIDINNFEKSDIKFQIQQTSSDTYLKANKLKSKLIKDSETLQNSIGLNLYSNDFSIDTEVKIYEELDKNDSDRFEYIFPKIDLVKKIDNKTDLNGDFSFSSENLVRNFNTNVFEKTNINDLIFSSTPSITKKGFYNNYNFLIKNSNTDTQNSSNFKEDDNYYVSGIFQLNSSFPLIKENDNHKNILKPNISLRLAPNSTKNLRDEEKRIDVNNIYELNRISENDIIEGGVSVVYGSNYSIIDEKNSREIFNVKFANNIRLENNDDLPTNNQIGEKTSNFFGEASFNLNDYLTTKYNLSLKNNLAETTYENLITDIKINNFITTFDYLNENNTTDQNSYLTNTTKYLIDESNSLAFSTRENKTSDLTEYYNFMYQYKNDCLSASIEYNKDFYNDRDVKPEESIFFRLTIIPFGETSSPNFKN